MGGSPELVNMFSWVRTETQTECFKVCDMVCIAGGVAAGFVYANLEYWLPRKKPDEVNWNDDAGVVLQN